MEAINSLGINAKLLIAQIINFLILLFLLSRFLYRPIVKMLDERSKKIEKSLSDAEKIEAELKETEVRNQKILEETHNQAKQIIAEAKTGASEEAKKIIAEAEKRSIQLKDRTVKEITDEKEKAKREIKQEAANLIALATEKVTEKKFDQSDDSKLIKEIIEQIK